MEEKQASPAAGIGRVFGTSASHVCMARHDCGADLGANNIGIRFSLPLIQAAQGKRLWAKIAKRIAAGATPYPVAKDLGIDRQTAVKYAL